MKITKEEAYRMVIEFHLKMGEGAPGIIKLGNFTNMGECLDELVEEGYLEVFDTGGSIGHPESNKHYFPTKGYHVFKDAEANGLNHIGYLNHIRFYFGKLAEEEGENNIQRAINPTHTNLSQNLEFVKNYAEWLERNRKELEILKSLDPYGYVPAEIVLTDEEKEYAKSKVWFEDNKSIKDCIKESKGGLENDEKYIKEAGKLISLLEQRNSSDDPDKIKGYKEEIDTTKREIPMRIKINKWMSTQDEDALIQDVLI
jgi:hypothetical protein